MGSIAISSQTRGEKMKIKYLDRETNTIKEEKVAGEKYLKWLYENTVGQGFLEIFVKKKLFSFLYGKLQDTKFSTGKISDFVKKYEIDMSDYKLSLGEFNSFNEFFYRELKEGARKISSDNNCLISPADGRLLAFDNINIEEILQVKGSFYSLQELIGDKKMAEKYQKGVCFVIRLCPIDYHRFHFPAAGVPEAAKKVPGQYYSVNPIALKKKPRVYCQNKREITIFHSDIFDDLLLIEVGATCVGSIVQTFIPYKEVKKGEEKGYFKFGGSTVIIFVKPGMVDIDQDLIKNTMEGLETKVKMGEGIAKRKQFV